MRLTRFYGARFWFGLPGIGSETARPQKPLHLRIIRVLWRGSGWQSAGTFFWVLPFGLVRRGRGGRRGSLGCWERLCPLQAVLLWCLWHRLGISALLGKAGGAVSLRFRKRWFLLAFTILLMPGAILPEEKRTPQDFTKALIIIIIHHDKGNPLVTRIWVAPM